MSAAKVWALVVGGALAYDVLAVRYDLETLTHWCREHPKPTLLIGSYLMAHLLGHPRSLHRYDPLHMAAGIVPRQRGRDCG